MSKNLLIVESPNKILKLKTFLNEDWDVVASVGHIRDLATWGTRLRLGLDLETMEPEYIELKDKIKIIENIIKETNKATNIYLATDPDREGEAIAYHIASIIKNKKANQFRITFNEITKKSVLESIKNPRELNSNLIQSQEARRILDRLIGFRLSFLTNKKISAKSAGRVKSSVLKLIIDRENEIEKFVPDFWWTIEAQISKEESIVNVDSEKYSLIKYKEFDKVEKVLKKLTGKFAFVERKESTKVIKAPQPLEMATYLMGMYNLHSTPNNSATFAAQSLYEKGLITYPRTDSKRISSLDFIESSKKYIKENFGENNYNGVSIIKNKKESQDAHEAIRPTDINKTPSSITGLKINEKRAYLFIWNTTIKSLMIDGQNKIIKDIYKDGEEFFSHKHSYQLIPGFRIVDGDIFLKETPIKKEIKVETEKIISIEHSTKPPGRYNPSSLIKLMKEEGIGRPSTYSGVISGLIGFGYLENHDGALKSTPMAKEVNDLLQNHFKDIVNEKYTSEMEDSLDEISQGKINSRNYLLEFWKNFEPRITKADEDIPVKPPVYTGKNCTKCKEGKMIFKRGRFGEFISCDQYPNCKNIESLIFKEPAKDANLECPECKSKLVIRMSNRTKNKFIACSSFPKCKYIHPEENTIEVLLDLSEITSEQKIIRIEKLEKRKIKEKKEKLNLKK